MSNSCKIPKANAVAINLSAQTKTSWKQYVHLAVATTFQALNDVPIKL